MKVKQSIENALPEGLVVNRKWLKEEGFNRPLVDYYLRAGVIEPVVRGVYRRPGPPLKWEHVVYSLQVLGYDVHVGGRTALELQGLGHYLPVRGVQRVFLYGIAKLPGWLKQYKAEYEFEIKKPRLFDKTPEKAITNVEFGHWDWPVRHAKPELALLQLMAEVKTKVDFEVADKIFEAALTLRPQLVEDLLIACRHVKSKRLFLWFAMRHNHSWLNKIDETLVDLGSGKRVVVKNGTLDKKYLVTVPKEMVYGSEQSIF